MIPSIKFSWDGVSKQWKSSLNIISALPVMVFSKENFIWRENTEGASLRGEQKKQMLPKSYPGNQMELDHKLKCVKELIAHREQKHETWFSWNSQVWKFGGADEWWFL